MCGETIWHESRSTSYEGQCFPAQQEERLSNLLRSVCLLERLKLKMTIPHVMNHISRSQRHIAYIKRSQDATFNNNVTGICNFSTSKLFVVPR